MDEPTFDADGYPTDETCERIASWPFQDCAGLMRFVRRAWHLADWGWREDGREFAISTGGWSGNESLIDALERNAMFWSLCWQQSRRGGHYRFEIPDWSNQPEKSTGP